jgi:LysM repeat protein
MDRWPPNTEAETPLPPHSPFRLLAPGALVATVVAVFLAISSAGSEPAQSAAVRATPVAAEVVPKRRTYTVRSGDTLLTVAKRYGVSVEALQEFNPNADPMGLLVGERLRLRPR